MPKGGHDIIILYFILYIFMIYKNVHGQCQYVGEGVGQNFIFLFDFYQIFIPSPPFRLPFFLKNIYPSSLYTTKKERGAARRPLPRYTLMSALNFFLRSPADPGPGETNHMHDK